MNTYLKQFIEENITLIENQMYDELYYQAQAHGSPIEYSGCGGLTQCLHQINLYPEYDFKELPEQFLAQAPQVIPNYIIPNNVQKISKKFGWRSRIQNLTIGKNVLELAEQSLYDINDLTYIELPPSIKTIGEGALCLNDSLEKIIFNCNIDEIPRDCCYANRALTKVDLPKNLKCIRYRAFGSCDNLNNITLPKTLVNIENEAFAYCYTLNNLSYNGRIADWKSVAIGKNAFYDVPAKTIRCSDGATKLRH